MTETRQQQTDRKCREIIRAIRDTCNQDDEPKIGFEADWGGNSLTVTDSRHGHSHVGMPEFSFDDLVDGLHGMLCEWHGLSFAVKPTD